MSKDIEIEIDPKTLKLFEKSIKRYGVESPKALLRAILNTAFAIETDAKYRLSGKLGSGKHIVTNRLRASVHTEFKPGAVKGGGGNTFGMPMTGIDSNVSEGSKPNDSSFGMTVDDLEALVGTNVEYAQKIEYDYDSFIGFAVVRNLKKFPQRVKKEWEKMDKKFKG